MEREENKKVLRVFVEKLKKSVKRELVVRKEIENDRASLAYVEKQKADQVEFENEVYDSYDTWIETIKKQINIGEKMLETILVKKAEIVALTEYIEKE